MGYEGAGTARGEPRTRSSRTRPVLVVLVAALMIHLFGPGLQSSTHAETAAPGQAVVEYAAHPVGADLGISPGEHPAETCHSLLGVTSAATAVSAVTCSIPTGRPDISPPDVRTWLSRSWIGGEGGDAAADPRRSPGVQRI